MTNAQRPLRWSLVHAALLSPCPLVPLFSSWLRPSFRPWRRGFPLAKPQDGTDYRCAVTYSRQSWHLDSQTSSDRADRTVNSRRSTGTDRTARARRTGPADPTPGRALAVRIVDY